jgi:hypothetical protein
VIFIKFVVTPEYDGFDNMVAIRIILQLSLSLIGTSIAHYTHIFLV